MFAKDVREIYKTHKIPNAELFDKISDLFDAHVGDDNQSDEENNQDKVTILLNLIVVKAIYEGAERKQFVEGAENIFKWWQEELKIYQRAKYGPLVAVFQGNLDA